MKKDSFARYGEEAGRPRFMVLPMEGGKSGLQRARVLGNTQAERSDTGATENIPPMDGADFPHHR